MNEALSFNLKFNTHIPVSFPLMEAPFKFITWFGIKLYRRVSFTIQHILKSDHSDEFSFWKTIKWRKKFGGLVSIKGVTLAQFCVSSKTNIFWGILRTTVLLIYFTNDLWMTFRLIDRLKRHVNPSEFILCQEVKEWCSLYVHIFAHGSIEYELN